MAKEATVRARIDPGLKAEVEDLFEALGLSTTEAITLFYHQVKLHKGLPFDVAIPNEVTRRVFEETDAGENLVQFQTADAMFENLGI
ncbi:type II toxin-antitoxin system RelB/DinJ family antitoxin [cf. Phormidesmis sp. LEGE 11477]|uniref:type II toxin-antitoxin system RelB/DinJ family antitoxin n=1 Tax=cf. Phormidesmis sp. LEGE 11477 TaxID=1828680 RepID=UPI00187ED4F4|nr:type II toxin-antitoxin system RelB/DinJ family antitoxin [cf. Phormidesmis sp. LEGE 11477]MBE9064497.1 type II toxin-antitoxin system RelB/DinJ family antitoxin [cf. Phormidesmis sp. LEGE 11477]